MPTPLSKPAVNEALDQLARWRRDGDHLVRTYETGGWARSALLFGLVSYLAEWMNHHPDVLVTYGSVTVRLTSHDAGGITERDVDLAKRIERAIDERVEPRVHPHAPAAWIG